MLPNWGGGGVFAYSVGRETRSVLIRDIVYLEVLNRKITIHTSDGGRDEFYGTLKDVQEGQLRGLDFIPIHASFLVNYHYIEAIGLTSVRLRGGIGPLPISRRRKAQVLKRNMEIMERRLARTNLWDWV